MGKGLWLLAVGVCLVASVQPLALLQSLLNPVGNILNSVVNVVGGVVEVVVPVPESVSICKDQTTGSLLNKALTGVVLTLGDTVSNVLGAVGDVLQAVVKLLTELIDALLGTIESLVVSLTTCYDSLLDQPLVTVKELELTAIASVNIQSVYKGLEDTLKPLQAILDSVVKQLLGSVATSCVANTALTNITAQAIGGLAEVIRCRNPLLKEVTKVTTTVGGTVAGAGDLVNKLLGNVTNCAKSEASSLDTGRIVSCLTAPVAKCRDGVDDLLAKVLPVVQIVLNKTLQIPECELKVVAKAVNTLINQLNQLAQCAAGNGVTVVVPSIPLTVPNFTDIAQKACMEIQTYISSALGPQSPFAQLDLAIDRLVITMDYICPAQIEIIVNKIINKTQESVDYVKETVKYNRNSEVKKCLLNAQNDLDKLGPKAAKEIVSCSAAIAPDAAPVIVEEAALEVELKKEKINACAEAFTKCIQYSKRSDKSIQRCFDEAVSDAQNRIIEINKKINAATEKANDLIKRDQKCLSEGVDDTEMKARNILKELKDCLRKLNVVVPSKELIVVVQTCTKDLKAFVMILRPVLNLVRDLIKTIEQLLAVILQIVGDVLDKVVVPLLEGVDGILKSLAGALAGNKNPAVQSCTGDRGRFQVLCVEAKERADTCVKNKKVLAAEYSLLAVTEERTVTTVIENAEVNAQIKCQGGESEAAIVNCYANFKSNLEVTVKLSKERVQYYESAVKLLVAETLSCVYTEETKTPVRVDNELEGIKVCLARENVYVYFKS